MSDSVSTDQNRKDTLNFVSLQKSVILAMFITSLM